MTEKRNVRSNDLRMSIRDEESRPQTNWQPPALLDAPEVRHGMVQRWVAASIQGKDTPDNVYKRCVKDGNHVKQKLVKGQVVSDD